MALSETDLARARSRLLDVVAAEVALKPKGREFAGLCPFHAERTPSFYVVPDKSMFHCFGCGAHGDAIGFAMRMRNLDFLAAVRWLLDLPENQPETLKQIATTRPRENESVTAERVAEIVRACRPVTRQSAAWLYLASRGLQPEQPALLAHPALYCHEVGKPLPALVAPIRDGERGEIVAVQRIWCADRIEFDGSATYRDGRAELQIRKKTLGRMGTGAVRLAPAGAALGLAEGVETAIAASMLYRMPVWAACGAARLGHLWLPPEVQQVIVFADRGATGEELAERAAGLIHHRGVACQVVFPEQGFGDFADQIIGRRSAA